MWEVTDAEVGTVVIEIIMIIAAITVLLVLLYLKKEYPELTKKGFIEFIIGVAVFTVHFVFDLLDTLALDPSITYDTFDILDPIFAFIGLFIIGYAFFRIARYGVQLGEGGAK